jgi:hypothetical protein
MMLTCPFSLSVLRTSSFLSVAALQDVRVLLLFHETNEFDLIEVNPFRLGVPLKHAKRAAQCAA